MHAATAHAECAFQQDVTTRPLDHIVAGVDFSAVSLGAARWLGRHLARDAALSLVHVIEPPPLPNVSRLRSARMADRESRLQARVESLRGALHGLSAVIGATDTRIEVRVGDPARQIAAYAEVVDADLVVVGGHVVSRAAPGHATATTVRLLRRLARPALVARNVQAAPTTVLAALGDEDAVPVLTVAQMVAAPCSARVATLRLADRPSVGSLASAERPARETSTLLNIREAVARRQQVRMTLDAARTLRADVIVIGSQLSETGDDDDAAHMLARAAHCSVLVVPNVTEAGPSAARGGIAAAPRLRVVACAGPIRVGRYPA